MEGIFVGRQPILDRKQELVAFELLFRSGKTPAANVTDDVGATASVIVNAIGELGLQNVLGRHQGFINVSAEMLMSDMIQLLPGTQVVLELLETVEIGDAVLRRCRELRHLGYRLAMDDVTEVDERVRALAPLVDMVKVDLKQVDEGALPGIVKALRPWPLSLVAEKVDSRGEAERCMALGFDLFQGYYFARPETVSGKRTDPSKAALLRLLALLSKDAEVAEIEGEFKHHPHLVYNLMRIVNSAAFGLPQKIDSPRQCIAVLGRNHLQRWVQLLLYTVGRRDGRPPGPLMQMAATRGKWMEILAVKQRPGDRRYHDCAFMVGILSLFDALLGLALPEIVNDLNLADEAKAALLARAGPLGSLLLLIEKKEVNDATGVAHMLHDSPYFTLGQFTAAELGAAGWADAVLWAA